MTYMAKQCSTELPCGCVLTVVFHRVDENCMVNVAEKDFCNVGMNRCPTCAAAYVVAVEEREKARDKAP